SGVCSRSISFDITTDGVVHGVSFEGGCNGNAQGLSKLVEGQAAEEVITRLAGIKCGGKQTSCPDQLSLALRQHIHSH
ncbi:TIGR03905 family TSCPD domain-containing protein, partial [Desulfovibrio sp. OttesenSCG-928-I05]|nr:TIGR03905 family TSCPD domain-containing protein [Desulfovibrio sp. OttesenSCG-928-I05]